MRKEFLEYEKAKEVVHKLNIKSRTEWENKYCKSDNFDKRLPKEPQNSYKKSGWVSWDDWLGVNREEYWKKEFLEYGAAKEVIHNLNIKSMTEWKKIYCKSDNFDKRLPKVPENTYKNKGWIDWYDFLGISKEEYKGYKKFNKNQVEYLSYEEAKTYMHKMNLKSEEEWREYKRNGLKPKFIPGKPRKIYYGEFKGFMDFLGFKYVKPKMSVPEKKIKKFLIENNIKFYQEKIFKECFFKKELPFDFYIPEYNLLIEYDGEHHFMPIKLFGGQENFELIQKKDKIKNEWAKRNKIKLIRINYKEYKNINKILEELFKNKKSIP